MAFSISGAYSDADSPGQGAIRRATIDKYSALGDFIDEINKVDNRELMVKTFGDQGITGFLKLTGAVKAAGTNDQVRWWEETRLHTVQKYAISADVAAAKSQTIAKGSSNALVVRVGDILLMGSNKRAYVSAVASDSSTFTVKALLNANLDALDGTPASSGSSQSSVTCTHKELINQVNSSKATSRSVKTTT